MSKRHDPILAAIRQQRYEQAIRDLPAHVARRWAHMPKTFTPAMALAWVRFRSMSEAEQMLLFVQLYQRSTVLSIDRATQIAESQSVVVMEAMTPAA